MIKNPPAYAGDVGSIPGSGRGSEKPHGQRSLAGYSPRGHKRVRHDLATKQKPSIFSIVSFSFCLKVFSYIFVV